MDLESFHLVYLGHQLQSEMRKSQAKTGHPPLSSCPLMLDWQQSEG